MKQINREQVLFAVAVAATWIHQVDDAFIADEAAAVPALVGCFFLLFAGLAFLYPRLRGWRAVPALLFGLMSAGANITEHAIPMLRHGPEPGDYTGALLATPGGIALLAIGIYVLATVWRTQRSHRQHQAATSTTAPKLAGHSHYLPAVVGATPVSVTGSPSAARRTQTASRLAASELRHLL